MGRIDGREEIDEDLYRDLTGLFNGEAGWANRRNETGPAATHEASGQRLRQDHTVIGPRYYLVQPGGGGHALYGANKRVEGGEVKTKPEMKQLY